MRLERTKEVLDAYHVAVGKTEPPKAEKAKPKKAKGKAKKTSSDLANEDLPPMVKRQRHYESLDAAKALISL